MRKVRKDGWRGDFKHRIWGGDRYKKRKVVWEQCKRRKRAKCDDWS